MNHQKTEVEYKWKLPSQKTERKVLATLKSLGAKIMPEKKVRIHDYYVETAGRLFSKKKITCRLRQINHTWQITMKRSRKLKHGLATRFEKTIRMPATGNKKQASQFFTKQILVPLFGKTAWLVQFEVLNRRTVQKVAIQGKFVGELSFDHTRIKKKSRSFGYNEIEFEFLKGNRQSFYSICRILTRRAKLQHVQHSKVATAHRVFRLN